MHVVFLYLQAIGHDMSASFLDEVRDVAKKFFQLPMEIKQKYSNIKEGEGFSFPLQSFVVCIIFSRGVRRWMGGLT